MTIQYLSAREITGTSSDTKPTTNTLTDTRFYETDTFKEYIWNGTSWDQHESFGSTWTTKTLDAESNTFQNLLESSVFANSGQRTGGIFPACTAVDSVHGCLDGLGISGDGTPTWALDATEGYVIKFSRAASGIAGYISSVANSNTVTTKRALNPFFKIRFKWDSISSTRLYIGFTSATSLPNTDTPLATTDSGVIFGYRTTDSNFSVINNDGSGAAVVNSTAIVKDTAWHTVSFTFSSSNVVVVLDDGAGAKTQTLSTRIPGTTTDIKLSAMGCY